MPPPSKRFGRNCCTPLVTAPSAPRSAQPVDEPRSRARMVDRSPQNSFAAGSRARDGRDVLEGFTTKAHETWAFGFGRRQPYAGRIAPIKQKTSAFEKNIRESSSHHLPRAAPTSARIW